MIESCTGQLDPAYAARLPLRDGIRRYGPATLPTTSARIGTTRVAVGGSPRVFLTLSHLVDRLGRP